MDKYNELLSNKIENIDKLINSKKGNIIDKSIVFALLGTFITLSTSLSNIPILKYIVLLSLYSGTIYTNIMYNKNNKNKDYILNKRKDKLKRLLKYKQTNENEKDINKKQISVDDKAWKLSFDIDKKLKCTLMTIIGTLIGIALSSVTPISLIVTLISEGLYVTYLKELLDDYKNYNELNELYNYYDDKLEVINLLKNTNNDKIEEKEEVKENNKYEKYVNKVIKQLEDMEYETTTNKVLYK